MKSIKKIFMILTVAMLMFSLVLATSYALATPKNEKTDIGIIIDSKSKTVSYKITWNANGGKIGTKKTVTTSVKKGSKIRNLATTPKRSGYTFKGWYTKKTGGTKINKNTKPTKSVTYYTQWKKSSSRVLTVEEKKLLGVYSQHPEHCDWSREIPGIEKIIPRDKGYNNMFLFKSDGTFVFTLRYLNGAFAGVYIFHGDFHVKNGKIATSNVKEIHTTGLYYGTLSGWKSANGQTYEFELNERGIAVNFLDSPSHYSWQQYDKR